MDERKTGPAIADEDLDAVVGGTAVDAPAADASADQSGATTSVMKTRHDTVKNTISNIH